jgi:coenzyme F420-0:L-glutamate ligase/coenzyme F420-1:gamma-L-glutamate ligase
LPTDVVARYIDNAMVSRPEMSVRCAETLQLCALPGLPIVEVGDDLVTLIMDGLARAAIDLRSGDVLVVTSKIVSRSTGRFVDLTTVTPSAQAEEVAREVQRDPRLVELVLRESVAISRKQRDLLITRHRLGFVCANAGIDCSNARPQRATADSGPWALLLPENPDAEALHLRRSLRERTGVDVAVVLSDSHGRPFRLGTVGCAIGVSGLPAIWDRRGDPDLFGNELQTTITALADQVAAAADLVAGQANEGRCVVHVRGLSFDPSESAAVELLRPRDQDVYA